MLGNGIMFRLGVFGTLCALWLSIAAAMGAEYRLNNGDVLNGQAASFNDDGLVVRLDLGGFSPRIPWGKLHVGLNTVQADVEAEKTPALEWELWLRKKVIGRIPGA